MIPGDHPFAHSINVVGRKGKHKSQLAPRDGPKCRFPSGFLLSQHGLGWLSARAASDALGSWETSALIIFDASPQQSQAISYWYVYACAGCRRRPSRRTSRLWWWARQADWLSSVGMAPCSPITPTSSSWMRRGLTPCTSLCYTAVTLERTVFRNGSCMHHREPCPASF